MSDVWYAIPSALPAPQAERCIAAWKRRGYRTMVWREEERDRIPSADVHFCTGPYPGYARAVNQMAAFIIAEDSSVQWIVTGGDDVFPDEAHDPLEIALQCYAHFARSYGVMQPTGDRWSDKRGAYIDRVAGSPWLGREWCQRANQGAGPLYPGFTHMFVDEFLRDLATHLGVYWERPDLIHFHDHALRARHNADDLPEHARNWMGQQHWREAKALYDKLKADGLKEGFPK